MKILQAVFSRIFSLRAFTSEQNTLASPTNVVLFVHGMGGSTTRNESFTLERSPNRKSRCSLRLVGSHTIGSFHTVALESRKDNARQHYWFVSCSWDVVSPRHPYSTDCDCGNIFDEAVAACCAIDGWDRGEFAQSATTPSLEFNRMRAHMKYVVLTPIYGRNHGALDKVGISCVQEHVGGKRAATALPPRSFVQGDIIAIVQHRDENQDTRFDQWHGCSRRRHCWYDHTVV
jgi:hypothetical protein